jgi:hypothetical protein
MPGLSRNCRPRLEPLEERTLLSVDPSAAEQYLLELTNRFRAQPAAELRRLLNSDHAAIKQALDFFEVDLSRLEQLAATLTPVPPVALDAILMQTAQAHNELMLELDQQSHQLPGEPTPRDRAIAAGYPGTYIGENVYAFARDVFYAHAGFVIDWGFGPGGIQDPAYHRINLLNGNFRDVGIHVLELPPDHVSYVGPQLVTQDFGRRTNLGPAQLLGVVYQDHDRGGFYGIGEGLAGVQVEISGPGGTFTTMTRTAGGYQLPLSPGQYTVTFQGGNLAGPRTFTTTVGSDNVQLDLRTGPLPVVNFRRARTVRTENARVTYLTLTLSRPSSWPVSVSYVVGDGTAANGVDYRLADAAVTFAPGQTQQRIRIEVVNDRLDEPAETLTVALTNPVGAILGARDQHTRMLRDDDLPPQVVLSPLAARSAAAGPFEVVVKLSASSGKTAEVRYVVQGGGLDQVGTATFLPGQTEQRLTLTPTTAGKVRVRLGQPRQLRLGDPFWCVFDG